MFGPGDVDLAASNFSDSGLDGYVVVAGGAGAAAVPPHATTTFSVDDGGHGVDVGLEGKFNPQPLDSKNFAADVIRDGDIIWLLGPDFKLSFKEAASKIGKVFKQDDIHSQNNISAASEVISHYVTSKLYPSLKDPDASVRRQSILEHIISYMHQVGYLWRLQPVITKILSDVSVSPYKYMMPLALSDDVKKSIEISVDSAGNKVIFIERVRVPYLNRVRDGSVEKERMEVSIAGGMRAELDCDSKTPTYRVFETNLVPAGKDSDLVASLQSVLDNLGGSYALVEEINFLTSPGV